MAVEILPWEGAIFEERGARCIVSAMGCTKAAEPIDLPFGW